MARLSGMPLRLDPRRLAWRLMPLAATAALAAAAALAGPAFAQSAPPGMAPTAGASFVVEGVLRLSGSNTIGAELAGRLLTAYGRQAGLTAVKIEEKADPDEHAFVMTGAESARKLVGEVSAHGTGTGFPDLAAGKAEIAMASRAVNEAERRLVGAAGRGDPAAPGNAHVLSLDGVLILVHPANPIAGLTLDQAKALFTGEIKDWAALGGKSQRVTIYARDTKSGTYDTFKALALGTAAMAPEARLFTSSEDLADSVASDPGGIGFVGLAYARNAKPLPIALSCGLVVPPRPFFIRTEEYPLSRRLFLYTPEQPTPLAADFVRFALTDAAQPSVDGAGFTSLVPELAGPENARERIAALGQGLAPADRARSQGAADAFKAVAGSASRLSITFRFEFGKADLDARALADVGRLIAWAKQPANAGRKLILVGHASGQGDFAYNVALSAKRAAEVADKLKAGGVAVEKAIGVGIASPIACNDEQTRGGLNRRVEVWVR